MYKIEEIIKHVTSPEVNGLYIEGQELGLIRLQEQVLNLYLILNLQVDRLIQHYDIHVNTVFNLELANAVQMFNVIELYASACYDNTQLHLSNIEKMEILDEIKNYDYKIRYPKKIKV